MVEIKRLYLSRKKNAYGSKIGVTAFRFKKPTKIFLMTFDQKVNTVKLSRRI